ncbi:MAG: sulfatase-like hydrolase/transferase [Bacteroidales bacterium]|nr:sulfatase-like hydrolase/transferase [Bacteroidales bacterium]
MTKIQQFIILLGLLSFFKPSLTANLHASDKNRPNIILILTDQQNANMLSYVGNPYVSTPNLDNLAQSGILFEQTFASNPVCAPSRFSLMTGLMPSQINGEDNGSVMRKKVPSDILNNSLGILFRNEGYETVYGGKVHLPGGQEGKANDVTKYGFRKLTNDSRDKLPGVCAEFLKQKHEKPFFLVASFINPHDICYKVINDWRKSLNEDPKGGVAWKTLQQALKLPEGVSEEHFFEKICPPLPDNFNISDDEFLEAAGPTKPFTIFGRENWTEKDWRLYRWAYKNLTELVDQKIGTLLQALYESDYDENTIVVFTSDHGEMDASHRLEHKSVFYNESVKIPLIIRWKGEIEPGLVDKNNLVINGLDLLPTLCDLAGIKIPKNTPGVSLKKVITGSKKKLNRDYIVGEALWARMVYDGEWKYMIAGNSEQHEMLFNLKNDPGEMCNLALEKEYKEQLERCRKLLIKWYKQNNISLNKAYVYK